MVMHDRAPERPETTTLEGLGSAGRAKASPRPLFTSA